MTSQKLRHARCEVDIVEHCNLACRACSHLSPVMPRREISADALHRDLVNVIEAVRSAVAPAKVAVVTNGTLLPRVPDAFWKAIDGVQVCFYEGKELGADELRVCRAQAKSHGVPMVVTPVDRFRESYSELGTSDQSLVRRIHDACSLKQATRSPTAGSSSARRRTSCRSCSTGSSPSRASSSTTSRTLGERLRAHLADPEPLGACRNCLGTSGKRFRQGQTSRSEFRPHQQHPTEDLVDQRELRPPSRMRARLKRVSPRYYRRERRLM